MRNCHNTTAGKRAAKIRQAVRSAALVAEPARFIEASNPEWVALEQVPAVLPLWQVYAAELRRMGYSIDTLRESENVFRFVLVAETDRPKSPPTFQERRRREEAEAMPLFARGAV